MYKLYEYFGIHEAEDRALNIEALLTLQLQGNDLRGFHNQWDTILATYYPVLEPTLLETLLRAQLRKVTGMNEDMAHYDRLPADDENKSYQFLIDAARRYVNRKRGESNTAIDAVPSWARACCAGSRRET